MPAIAIYNSSNRKGYYTLVNRMFSNTMALVVCFNNNMYNTCQDLPYNMKSKQDKISCLFLNFLSGILQRGPYTIVFRADSERRAFYICKNSSLMNLVREHAVAAKHLPHRKLHVFLLFSFAHTANGSLGPEQEFDNLIIRCCSRTRASQ